jgi:hypothetical protein|tara:strand:+ start:1480 stop:2943 length:1464 start_codon:yes stop_codon:yes gene_type:complete
VNRNNFDDEDRLYYEGLGDELAIPQPKATTLPKVVEQYVKSAADVSKYNEIPAAIGFFVILGQLAKDMVAIPSGRRVDDTRIQFIWMQTSGTGKTEMYNFFGPVANEVFRILDDKYGVKFDVFSVDDTTDAALIGSMRIEKERVENEDGEMEWVEIPTQIDGGFEGSGLVAYDEFEYSGVFKQSQHKENVIMYLNKFMNTLHGENWIIRKKLRDGDIIQCRCQRSIYATTYIPKTLTNVIAEKGVIQRTLIYIKEVPQEVQDELREKVLDEVGTIKPKDAPIKKFAQNFVIIYDALKKRYEETGEDPLRTVTFGKGFNDALKNESIKMRNYVANSRPEVFEIAGNFITRLNQTMTRLSVLCCIAEAPNITDPKKRYIVTERHARQASSLIRQCYKSLVSWLDVALKVRTHALHERVGVNDFRKAYKELRTSGDEGWVNKTLLLSKVREDTKKGQTTVYNNFKTISNMFETKKIGVRAYLKIKEEKET